MVIWCNAADYIWITSNAKGLVTYKAFFTCMSKTAWVLETSLELSGFGIAEDRRLGLLHASPADIGTALSASVSIKLIRLWQHQVFLSLMKRLCLEKHERTRIHKQPMVRRDTPVFLINGSSAY
jgi:protein-arginine kinase